MKSLEFLQKSFVSKELYLQNVFIHFDNKERVESLKIKFTSSNISNFYSAFEKFENHLLAEYQKLQKGSAILSPKEFIESINFFDKVLAIVVKDLYHYYNNTTSTCETKVYLNVTNFDFTTNILFQGYHIDNVTNGFNKLSNAVFEEEYDLFNNCKESIRKQLCEVIQLENPIKENNGQIDDYVFNKTISADNLSGFYLQITDL